MITHNTFVSNTHLSKLELLIGIHKETLNIPKSSDSSYNTVENLNPAFKYLDMEHTVYPSNIQYRIPGTNRLIMATVCLIIKAKGKQSVETAQLYPVEFSVGYSHFTAIDHNGVSIERLLSDPSTREATNIWMNEIIDLIKGVTVKSFQFVTNLTET